MGKKDTSQERWYLTTSIVLLIATLLFYSLSGRRDANNAFVDYDSLKKMKHVELASNIESWSPEGKKENIKQYNGLILKKISIFKGYLEIVASIDDKPLTVWESIYFKAPCNLVNQVAYGGHLFRPKSIKVPKGGWLFWKEGRHNPAVNPIN